MKLVAIVTLGSFLTMSVRNVIKKKKMAFTNLNFNFNFILAMLI